MQHKAVGYCIYILTRGYFLDVCYIWEFGTCRYLFAILRNTPIGISWFYCPPSKIHVFQVNMFVFPITDNCFMDCFICLYTGQVTLFGF